MRGVLAIIISLLALLAGTPARADAYTDAVARFAADSYSDTEAGIEGVAASGNPLAAELVAALQAGRLLVRPSDKAVFIRDVPPGLAADKPAAGKPRTGSSSPAATSGTARRSGRHSQS